MEPERLCEYLDGVVDPPFRGVQQRNVEAQGSPRAVVLKRAGHVERFEEGRTGALRMLGVHLKLAEARQG